VLLPVGHSTRQTVRPVTGSLACSSST
jgi:hypothetical protein